MDNNELIFANILPDKTHRVYHYMCKNNTKILLYSPSERISNIVWGKTLNTLEYNNICAFSDIIKNCIDTHVTPPDNITVILHKGEKLNINLIPCSDTLGAKINKFNVASMFEKSTRNKYLSIGMHLSQINQTDCQHFEFSEIINSIQSDLRPFPITFKTTDKSLEYNILSNTIKDEKYDNYSLVTKCNVLQLNYSSDTLFEYIALKLSIYKNNDKYSTTCQRVFHHGTHMSNLNFANYTNNSNVEYIIVNIALDNIDVDIVYKLIDYIKTKNFEIVHSNTDINTINIGQLERAGIQKIVIALENNYELEPLV